MPRKPIPFTNAQASGYDPLGGAGVVSMNVVTEATGAVRRRPGIRAFSEAPTSPVAAGAVTGLYATQRGQLFAVTDDTPERTIHYIASGSSFALGSGVSPYGLAGSRRPVFAETPMLLVIAGGAEMQKIDLATTSSSRLGGNPPFASHVAAIAQRLVANDLTLDPGTVRYSDIAGGTVTYAGHEVWTDGVGDAGAVTAEGRPDPVLAIAENTNELFAFGSTSVQIFAPDPQDVFATVSAREYGLGASNSVVKSDTLIFWLDEKRRFVLGDGRSFEVISDAIKGALDAMGTVDDCFGYRVVLGPVDAVVWTFPSEGRTFVFQKGSGWGQWQSWKGNAWAQFLVTAHLLRFGDARNIVGLDSGRVSELSFEAETDLGHPINAHVTTGYLDHGTDGRKHCEAVLLALRRGETTSSTEPQAWLRYRDRPGPWQGSIPVRLGRSGDTEIVVRLGSFGTYRRRQWQFEFSGPESLVLLGATEEFTLLEE